MCMGNTVGSANTDFWNLTTADDAYIVGLWCADGYYRTSSIGISNTNLALVGKFRDFFLEFFRKVVSNYEFINRIISKGAVKLITFMLTVVRCLECLKR